MAHLHFDSLEDVLRQWKHCFQRMRTLPGCRFTHQLLLDLLGPPMELCVVLMSQEAPKGGNQAASVLHDQSTTAPPGHTPSGSGETAWKSEKARDTPSGKSPGFPHTPAQPCTGGQPSAFCLPPASAAPSAASAGSLAPSSAWLPVVTVVNPRKMGHHGSSPSLVPSMEFQVPP